VIKFAIQKVIKAFLENESSPPPRGVSCVMLTGLCMHWCDDHDKNILFVALDERECE
jgi:hypothetical protein